MEVMLLLDDSISVLDDSEYQARISFSERLSSSAECASDTRAEDQVSTKLD